MSPWTISCLVKQVAIGRMTGPMMENPARVMTAVGEDSSLSKSYQKKGKRGSWTGRKQYCPLLLHWKKELSR